MVSRPNQSKLTTPTASEERGEEVTYLMRRRKLPETSEPKPRNGRKLQTIVSANAGEVAFDLGRVRTVRWRRVERMWSRELPSPKTSPSRRDSTPWVSEERESGFVGIGRERNESSFLIGPLCLFYKIIAFGELRKCPSSSRPRIETCRPSTNSFRRFGRNGLTRFAKFASEK